MNPSLRFLSSLLAHRTVTRHSNLESIEWVSRLLDAHGIEHRVLTDSSGTKANLHAWIGPLDRRGLMLCGHTDVVPVDGQEWSVDPFAATLRDGRVYGRGSADMKGFIACALAAMLEARTMPLRRPLHLALSYDEEIGCVGVRDMLDVLAHLPARPSTCIVGEPTSMRIATGHKGKMALRACCRGHAAHSALATSGLNAIHLATELVTALRDLQRVQHEEEVPDDAYEVPYSTLHVGRIAGGVALNIVPDACTLDIEIRHLAGTSPDDLLIRLENAAQRIVAPCRKAFPAADIEIEVVNAYPGLDTPAADAGLRECARLLDGDSSRPLKVSYGTEGGLYRERLPGCSVIVCGPGSMEQGHKPDEFVLIEQLQACDGFLRRVTSSLSA
jgi:acetylornithine deacetylase